MDTRHREAVAELMVNTLHARLGDEVELVFRYGSSVRGETHRWSDLDFSYVPRHESTSESITVLVDEILFDLYPLHWSTLARMAEHDDRRATILADVQLTYAATPEARARLDALVARYHALEAPRARGEMAAKALAAFQETGYELLQVSRMVRAGELEAARLHANRVLQILFHVLVLQNQSRADTRRLEELLALERRPAHLDELVTAVLRARDGAELETACSRIAEEVRTVLHGVQEETQCVQPHYAAQLGAGFPELEADLQRVLLACERGDLLAAQTKLFSFLHELHVHLAAGERGIAYSQFNSADEYRHEALSAETAELVALASAGRLDELHDAAREFDGRLRSYLRELGVNLFAYGSIGELRRAVENGEV